jgi:hypothetical protein
MLERRRARSTSRLMEPLDVRRDSSFWMPAFMAAAAASECGGVCDTGGDCDTAREGSPDVDWVILLCIGEADGDGEGGNEFRSGGIALAGGILSYRYMVCRSRNDAEAVMLGDADGPRRVARCGGQGRGVPWVSWCCWIVWWRDRATLLLLSPLSGGAGRGHSKGEVLGKGKSDAGTRNDGMECTRSMLNHEPSNTSFPTSRINCQHA